MAPLTDLTRLEAYKDALSNWAVEGYVQFELSEEAYRWIKNELNNMPLKEIKRLMYEFEEGGGTIDEVKEMRETWRDDYEFHHDLRFTIQDKPVYIETRLHYKEPIKPDDSWILVVNIHEQ